MVKFTSPAVGEEQVVDIELDKATVLMPIRLDYTPIDAKVLWNLDASHQEPTGSVGSDKQDAAQDEPTEGEHCDTPLLHEVVLNLRLSGYAKILSSLLGNFPMTLKGTLVHIPAVLLVMLKFCRIQILHGVVPQIRPYLTN